MLVDRDGVASRLVVGRPAGMDTSARARELLDAFFSGYTWPARLAGRGERGSLLYNGITVIYSLIVPALLIQEDPDAAYRAPLHNERFLSAQRRDGDLVREAHRALLQTTLRELRGAAEAAGVEWPAQAEAALIRFNREELGIDLASP